ncbi:hypothetical protein RJ639_007210 [Escallonia herrerae]|uniref:Fe2OG dioxygenase domain-containing protein n=1 Tax=Escallonia herrerae TaxID=1293975 RepID=A0AA89AW61_9ASTE|nr:hypothetical protein RJ639_007210 [Escallonia herrerae]
MVKIDGIRIRKVTEEFFTELAKVGQLVEGILNDCLGLPAGFLKEYNNDRSWDVMLVFRYYPATKADTIGAYEHQDVNNITFVFQDDVGGLEVQKDGEWIRVTPIEGALVANVGDMIQALSNNKFKSGVHRVVSPEGASRHSIAFFYHLEGEKWVEPLSHFTEEIGDKPKYRGFPYKEYYALRLAWTKD